MKYWNLNFINDSEQVDISMVEMNKGIVNINLHTHSCNNRRFPRLKQMVFIGLMILVYHL